MMKQTENSRASKMRGTWGQSVEETERTEECPSLPDTMYSKCKYRQMPENKTREPTSKTTNCKYQQTK
jgi:hypothetical protein